MDLKQFWDNFLYAINVGLPPSMVGAPMGIDITDPLERARLLQASKEQQVELLREALSAAPEYRAQLADASAAWDTWKKGFVRNKMRQALGKQTTEEEMQALIDAYRRMAQG